MAAFVTVRARLPRIGARINLPGSFWTGCPAADKAKLFAVTVVEVEENHVFTARQTGPGARLMQMADLDSDEESPEAVPNLWITAKTFSDFEKKHKVRCREGTIPVTTHTY